MADGEPREVSRGHSTLRKQGKGRTYPIRAESNVCSCGQSDLVGMGGSTPP
ncbi:MAG: hypothetical protein PUA93_00790 [Eubacteriales bacterium]|nr:hypothetical protein [Eubacteriales bacterium]